MKQVAITTVSWYYLYEGSDIKIATCSNLHNFEFTQEGLRV